MGTKHYFIAITVAILGLVPPAQAAVLKPDIALSRLDAAERDYHDQLFDYVMQAIEPGKEYAWKSYGASGVFHLGARMVRGNTQCRDFREEITLKNGDTTTLEGVGCKRVGDDGWCRLRKADMHSCALEPPRDMLGKALRNKDDLLFQGSETVRRNKNSWWNWWPF